MNFVESNQEFLRVSLEVFNKHPNWFLLWQQFDWNGSVISK